MPKPDLVTVRIQVRTKALGSGWSQRVQVDRQEWGEMSNNERAGFIKRMALSLRLVRIDFAEEKPE